MTMHQKTFDPIRDNNIIFYLVTYAYDKRSRMRLCKTIALHTGPARKSGTSGKSCNVQLRCKRNYLFCFREHQGQWDPRDYPGKRYAHMMFYGFIQLCRYWTGPTRAFWTSRTPWTPWTPKCKLFLFYFYVHTVNNCMYYKPINVIIIIKFNFYCSCCFVVCICVNNHECLPLLQSISGPPGPRGVPGVQGLKVS